MIDRTPDSIAGYEFALLVWIVAMITCVVGGGCAKKTNVAGNSFQTTAVDRRPQHQRDGYVGSERCAECHAEIAEQYRSHSMSRSASAAIDAEGLQHLDSATFITDGFRYQVSVRNGDVFHYQGRVTSQEDMAVIDLPVKHVIGSGNHGQSFLVARGEHLMMSPITWYPGKERWDLSPGFEKNNSQFNRPIIDDCLYCHTDLTTPVANTLNKYESPGIVRHAIGCERCHGPGEQHLAYHEATGDNPHDSIINPAKLSVELQGAICNQCHLAGAARVKKPGKQFADFRPGQPMEAAFTVFVHPNPDEPKKFVGHVEQMHASQCFVASNGQLTCTSCHDPHGLPEPDERLSFYRDGCLRCHTQEACQEDPSLRDSRQDSCIACHMPTRETEIQHAATTDHSIPKVANASPNSVAKQTVKTAAFPSNRAAKPTPRDQAVAVAHVAQRKRDTLATNDIDQAKRALEDAIRTNPADVDATNALAELYLASQQVESAARICRQLLTRVPNSENTLVLLGDIYVGTGNHPQSVSIWRQLLTLNPWMAKYWYKLGQSYAAMGQWTYCRQLAQDGKKRFPTSIGLRYLLMQSHVQLNDVSSAEKELAELEAFDPPGIEQIRGWYESHKP